MSSSSTAEESNKETQQKQQQQQQQQPSPPVSSNRRVLSIQSHVVHGYVGNKAAVFPLQLLGYDVDFINSVNFASHTGYQHFPFGEIMNGEQLLHILKGLQLNDLLIDIKYMLTGYIGSVSFLEAVVEVLQTIRKQNPSVQYVCDPVLGDNGKYYVPPELTQVYKTKVLPHATVVTPNQFEVEQLTSIEIKTLDDAKRACQALHKLGPSTVFITSCVLENDDETETTKEQQMISIIASTKQQHQQPTDDDNDSSDDYEYYCIECPKIPGNFTGTGDVTAALLLGHLGRGDDIKQVMEKVINTMYLIIEKTYGQKGTTVSSKELKLIQSKNIIEDPTITYKSRKI
jgi:pyridoxine kinase